MITRDSLISCIEPGDTISIEFHYGSQLENLEGSDYDDDCWSLSINDKLICVGDTLEDIIKVIEGLRTND